MVTETQKKAGIIVGALIIVISLLYLTGNLPSFAILSSDYNIMLENGKVYHEVTLSASSPSGGTYILHPQDKTLPNGSIVKSSETVSFEISPLSQRCEYALDADPQPEVCLPALGCHNFNLWTEYHLINPQLKAPVSVSSDNGKEPIILEGATQGNRGTITDKDGKGIATVETQGGLTASQFCPAESGRIMVIDQDGKPKVMSETEFNNKKEIILSQAAVTCGAICFASGVTSILCRTCVGEAVEDIKYGTIVEKDYSFHSSPIKLMEAVPYGSTATKTLLRAYLNSGAKYAIPVVTVTADQDFVDSFIYSPPKVGNPEIVSFTTLKVPESKESTRAAVFGNNGDTATFTYTVTAKLGNIYPSSQSVQIEGGSQAQVSFTYSAPSVTANDEETITVKLCAGNEFGGSCTQKVYTFEVSNDEGIIPTPDPDAEWCGNDKCSAVAGENTQTCPEDCTGPAPTTCDATKHLVLRENECICQEGYLTRFDAQTGEKSCVEPQPEWMAYLPYALITIVVLGGAYLIIRTPHMKRSYRRRGRRR